MTELEIWMYRLQARCRRLARALKDLPTEDFKLAERYYEIEEEIEQAEDRMEEIMKKIADLEKSLL
jgi:predicted  nucleic acid-binding Zn-ribbon protein